MTDRGREFTVHLKRKAALKGKEEFRLQLVAFEKSIYDIGSPDFIRSEVQKLKSLADNAIQGFIDWMNLTVEAEEINEITRQQYELQSSWEKVRATALSRLDILEAKEETKSNLSYGSRISSSSSATKLLGLKAKRAAPEQKIIFADTIKEQEKALAKLKLQQELSETLAEEAVYQVALNAGDENNEHESPSQVTPEGFGNIIDKRQKYERKPSTSVSSHVTNSSATVTQASSSVIKEQSSSFVTQSSTSVIQSLRHVTQSSSPVTQSSSFLTRPSAPISVSVTQTSALGSRPLASSVPAFTQSSVSLPQSLPPVTHHSAYLGGGYTSSTPMSPHGAYITTSLQQGLVTSPVMYQQAYQDFTPQSLYGNPPLNVPLQSQPPQPSSVYVLPSPDNTQQITEALAEVTQLHRLPQVKPDVFRREEEDKTKFFLWESAFDALIDSVPVAPRQKLHLLFQHLEGRAKKVVEQLQFMIDDPEKTYKESRKRLKYRFGNSAILGADFEKRLTNWPKIGNNDAKGIQEFSDFLVTVPFHPFPSS